jgi:hypothetical protein
MKSTWSIQGPFVAHRLALLNSPAWHALSGRGIKVLSRIELELLKHGGKNNGELVIPYSDFQLCGGGHKSLIARAIREAEVLGLLEIKRGRGGNGQLREASKYRLTYLPAGGAEPTDEWSKINSTQKAHEKLQTIKRKRQQSGWLQSAKLAKAISSTA